MYLKQILLVGVAAALIGCDGGDPKVSDFGTTNSPGTATISGVGLVGETLTATLADADGIQQNTVAYQWNGDGSPIAGATSSSYTLTAAEGRQAVNVSIRYTDDRDLSSTAVSNSITARPLNVAPTLEINVPDAGAIVGQALTAALVDGNGFGAVTYQWIGSVTGPIAGATGVTFRLTPNEVGETISVSATYTDDDGYDEDLTSAAAVGPVTSPPPEGNVELTGDIVVGATLTATVFDGDGFAAAPAINYVWVDENGVELLNETTDDLTSELLLLPAQLGLSVTVTASYTDAAANVETPSETTRDFIHTILVDGEISLAAAVAAALDGDIIGLDSALGADNYEDMAELEITTDNITLRLVNDSTAVITGFTCIVYGSSTTGVVIDGLVFDDLMIPDRVTASGNCDEGEGSVKLQGSFNTFSNNQFLGQADTRVVGGSDEIHYMTVGGTDNVVERNLFEGLPTSEAKEGAGISMYISRSSEADPVNQPNGSNERNIVQYNLFRNFLPDTTEGGGTEWDTDSNGFGVQVGRSSSRDGAGYGGHVVQYNRFDTVLTDRRIILVQGGGNTIHGNTIVNSWGNVALEHGYDNTVSSNIIISSGVDYEDMFGGVLVGDNLDGGISFVPLGHTIVDNYVGNISSNSSDRAGLHIDSETLEPSDSSSEVIWTSGLDLTNVVARNTFINIRNAIQFEHNADENNEENCTRLDYLLDFDDNLIANQSSVQSIFGTSAGASRTAILLDEYTDPHGCRLDNASEFTNTHIYSALIADDDILFRDGTPALVSGVNGNIAVIGSEDGATLTAPDANGLVEGAAAGPDENIGADRDALTFITEDMVGPGSTWTAP